MELIHQFLLRVKRRTEQGDEIITSKICSAKEISDFIEYSDLQDDVVDYDIKYIDGKTINDTILLSENDSEKEFEDISFKALNSKNGTFYGFKIEFEEPHSVKIQINLVLSICRNDIKPAFVFEKEAVNV